MKIYEYTVEGRGDFPFDMLRYDCAWPAIGDSAAYLIVDQEERRMVRKIRLRSIQRPTEGRWSSFGWTAHSIKTFTSGR